jgi:hypothetical protein
MEPEVRAFLQRIVWSLSATLVWLLINTIAGLRFQLAVFDQTHQLGTIIFYFWFLGSFVLLFKIFKNLWRNHL